MNDNEKRKEDLKYKQAYYYLFNNITEVIKMLRKIQRQAEDICISETISESMEIDANGDYQRHQKIEPASKTCYESLCK